MWLVTAHAVCEKNFVFTPGCGSKLNYQGTAGFSPCVHLPIGSHGHLTVAEVACLLGGRSCAKRWICQIQKTFSSPNQNGFTLLVPIVFDDGSRRQKPTPGDRQGWRGTETASGPEDAAEACGGAKTWGVLSVHGDLGRVGLKENVRDNNQRLGSQNKRHPFGFHPKHLFRARI